MLRQKIWIFGIILIFSINTAHASDWQMFGHDSAHTGTTDEAIEPPLELLWKYKTGTGGNEVWTSPAVSDSIAYIGSTDNYIYAIDTNSGDLKWKYKVKAGTIQSPTASDNIVFIGADGVYALDALTGDQIWDYSINEGASFSSPIISGGTVYIGSEEGYGSIKGYISAIDVKTGKLKWKYQAGDKVRSSPAISGNLVYVGSLDGYVYALDSNTGDLKWKYKTGNQVFSSPSISDDTLYIGSNDGSVYVLDANTGNLKWKYKTGHEVRSSPAVSGGIVYIGSLDNSIYALDAGTGNLKWKFQTGGRVESSPAVSGGTIYISSLDS